MWERGEGADESELESGGTEGIEFFRLPPKMTDDMPPISALASIVSIVSAWISSMARWRCFSRQNVDLLESLIKWIEDHL